MKVPIEGAPRTGSRDRLFRDHGYCAGCGENHINLKTASVAGFPFLCKNCYSMVYKYSCFREDPYRIKKMPRDEMVSIEKTRKVIQSGRRLEFIEKTFKTWMMQQTIEREREEYYEQEESQYFREPVKQEKNTAKSFFEDKGKQPQNNMSMDERNAIKRKVAERGAEYLQLKRECEKIKEETMRMGADMVPFNPYENNDYYNFSNDIFYAALSNMCAGTDSKYRIWKGYSMVMDYYSGHPFPGAEIDPIQTGNIYLITVKYYSNNQAELIIMYRKIVDQYKKEYHRVSYDAGFIRWDKGYLCVCLKCYKFRIKSES
ncbi:MAG: hypothetical protein K6F00_06450 [Lachnospiraceae bacterium]|nr:hypothetical protein [Lachnospiraceae bacterium]